MSHVSLRDVAEQSGVSFQTVSKVLRGTGSVAPATRQRILDAAAALGYVPNTLARGLATRSTRSIGFIASGLASFVLAPLLLGAEREAHAHGYFIVFALATGHEDEADRLVRQLVERRVDGIVNAALTLQHDQRYGELLRTLTPSVGIFPVRGGGIPLVGEDPALTGYIATRHLVNLGHRRIATILGDRDPRAPSGRLRGYRQALEEVGVEPDPNLAELGSWTGEGGYQAMQLLLDRAPDLTAVFSQNDHMAIGAISALHDRGLRVPEDVAIVGCDDIDLARYTIPPLTTVRISFENDGAAAVRLLLDRIANPETTPSRIVLPVELIKRSSCGHLATAKDGGRGSDSR
ncbi:MAG: LacI family DNA-binding transcriptional regulator [Thermomicrobiales bacterium]